MVTAILFETILTGLNLSLKIYVKCRDSCRNIFANIKGCKNKKPKYLSAHLKGKSQKIGDAKVFHFTMFLVLNLGIGLGFWLL